MSTQDDAPMTVREFAERALPGVNEKLDWEQLQNRYDPDPIGNTLGMVLYVENDDGDDRVVESFGFKVTEGPAISIVEYGLQDAADPGQVLGMGDVITYRDTAINVLHPDKDLTPQKACYQRGKVDISTADPMQKRRVWIVGSAIMEMITSELDNILPAAEAP